MQFAQGKPRDRQRDEQREAHVREMQERRLRDRLSSAMTDHPSCQCNSEANAAAVPQESGFGWLVTLVLISAAVGVVLVVLKRRSGQDQQYGKRYV